MTISGVSSAQGTGSYTHAEISPMMGGDGLTQQIQSEINRLQQQIQELDKNEVLSSEEKMKKKQELHQQITDLNGQLRARQKEIRQQNNKPKEKGMDAYLGQKRTASKKEAPMLSASGMQALLSGDTALKQSDVQRSVASEMEGRANVLEIEIKLDASRGGDTTAKEEQLAEVKQTMESALTASVNSAAEGLEQAEAAGESGKAEGTGEKAEEEKEEENLMNASEKGETLQPENLFDASAKINYSPVDIRL